MRSVSCCALLVFVLHLGLGSNWLGDDVGGFCYLFLDLPNLTSWVEAQHTCDQHAAQLPMFKSEIVQHGFYQLLQTTPEFSQAPSGYFTLGLQKKNGSKMWKWSDGSQLTNSSWSNWSAPGYTDEDTGAGLAWASATGIVMTEWRAAVDPKSCLVVCQKMCNGSFIGTGYENATVSTGSTKLTGPSNATLTTASMSNNSHPAGSVPTELYFGAHIDIIMGILIGLVACGILLSVTLCCVMCCTKRGGHRGTPQMDLEGHGQTQPMEQAVIIPPPQETGKPEYDDDEEADTLRGIPTLRCETIFDEKTGKSVRSTTARTPPSAECQ